MENGYDRTGLPPGTAYSDLGNDQFKPAPYSGLTTRAQARLAAIYERQLPIRDSQPTIQEGVEVDANKAPTRKEFSTHVLPESDNRGRVERILWPVPIKNIKSITGYASTLHKLYEAQQSGSNKEQIDILRAQAEAQLDEIAGINATYPGIAHEYMSALYGHDVPR